MRQYCEKTNKPSHDIIKRSEKLFHNISNSNPSWCSILTCPEKKYCVENSNFPKPAYHLYLFYIRLMSFCTKQNKTYIHAYVQYTHACIHTTWTLVSLLSSCLTAVYKTKTGILAHSHEERGILCIYLVYI